MDFEDYKTKIQKVSNILEHAKYPEDILNSKEIDFENDFQYICLNSTINSDIVNEVIVRLAQNGNRELVENNSKYISINIWNDIFDKNNAIKEIFIAGFKQVIENTGFVTYRDIESFIADKQTINVIYENIKTIIKKNELIRENDEFKFTIDFAEKTKIKNELKNEICKNLRTFIEEQMRMIEF